MDHTSRRQALKALAAGGVAAATWSAPTLTSVSPVSNYAAAFTPPSCPEYELRSDEFTVQLRGIAVNDNCDIFVSNDRKLIGFHDDSSLLFSVNLPIDPPLSFLQNNGVAVDPAGNIYVAEAVSGTVFGYDPTGTLIFTKDNNSAEPPNPPWKAPWDLAFDTTGNLYVCDTSFENPSIYKFAPDGSQLLVINNSSPLPFARFQKLSAIAVNNNGIILATDERAGALHMFTPAVTGFRSEGALWPWGLAVDSANNVFVISHFGDTLTGYTAGSLQEFFSLSSADVIPGGDFRGVAVGCDGRLYVTCLAVDVSFEDQFVYVLCDY